MQSITVILPTYNRSAILRKVLQGFVCQTKPQALAEILVVDDGSTDDTRSVVADHQSILPIRYLYQPNRGPASARNWGIREATTALVLFIDDDIIPSPELLEQHMYVHAHNPEPQVAVQGYVTWSKEVKVTPFMRWYGEKGPLFAFGHIRNGEEVDFRYFYTCNASLKTALLRTHGGFHESFKVAAFEDTELAYRLLRCAGMRLLYNRKAVAYHYQHFTFGQAAQRALRVAAGQRDFLKTEAGQLFREQNARWTRRTAEWLVRRSGAFLKLLKPLMDSPVPLPGLLYRAMYWRETADLVSTAEASGNRQAYSRSAERRASVLPTCAESGCGQETERS